MTPSPLRSSEAKTSTAMLRRLAALDERCCFERSSINSLKTIVPLQSSS
jgi:hypothetical protein